MIKNTLSLLPPCKTLQASTETPDFPLQPNITAKTPQKAPFSNLPFPGIKPILSINPRPSNNKLLLGHQIRNYRMLWLMDWLHQIWERRAGMRDSLLWGQLRLRWRVVAVGLGKEVKWCLRQAGIMTKESTNLNQECDWVRLMTLVLV